MDIQIDSREKARAIKKILTTFDKKCVNYAVSKLMVGDYMNLDNPRVIIDRKQNLSEIYQNICHDKKRFTAELDKAYKMNIRLIILCEHSENVCCLEDVKHWNNPRLQKNPYAWCGNKLYKEMMNLSVKYKIEFKFCTKQQTGERILEILRQ